MRSVLRTATGVLIGAAILGAAAAVMSRNGPIRACMSRCCRGAAPAGGREPTKSGNAAAKREPTSDTWDVVDEASAESFPASDPPAY